MAIFSPRRKKPKNGHFLLFLIKKFKFEKSSNMNYLGYIDFMSSYHPVDTKINSHRLSWSSCAVSTWSFLSETRYTWYGIRNTNIVKIYFSSTGDKWSPWENSSNPAKKKLGVTEYAGGRSHLKNELRYCSKPKAWNTCSDQFCNIHFRRCLKNAVSVFRLPLADLTYRQDNMLSQILRYEFIMFFWILFLNFEVCNIHVCLICILRHFYYIFYWAYVFFQIVRLNAELSGFLTIWH